MAEDVPISPRTRKALLWGTLLVLVPVLGALGWVVVQLMKPSQPCPPCDAIDTGEPAKVRATLDAGAPADGVAWHHALQHMVSSAEAAGAPLEIVLLLLERGGDPNDFWTPTGTYTVSRRSERSLRLGNTTLGTGDGPRTASRRRVFAAAVVAGATADVAPIERFLAKGLDIHGRGAGEALIAATRAGHVDVVRRLLDAGVPPNYVASEAPRRTALAEAIQTLDLTLIAALEAKGAREW